MIKKESSLLRNVQLFSSLSDQELQQITDAIRIKSFKKQETILHEEDTNEYMYTILAGKVKVVQTSEDGKETILAMHKTGDFFGEMSLIDGKTMPATVIATEETITAIISKQEFISLICSQEKVLLKLLIILCARLRESWNKIQMLNFNNAAHRIKMLFTMLVGDYGEQDDEGITLNLKLTHQDIANMAGITRETVTRVIDKWQKDNEITILKNRHIRLQTDFLKRDLPLSSRARE